MAKVQFARGAVIYGEGSGGPTTIRRFKDRRCMSTSTPRLWILPNVGRAWPISDKMDRPLRQAINAGLKRSRFWSNSSQKGWQFLPPTFFPGYFRGCPSKMVDPYSPDDAGKGILQPHLAVKSAPLRYWFTKRRFLRGTRTTGSSPSSRIFGISLS